MEKPGNPVCTREQGEPRDCDSEIRLTTKSILTGMEAPLGRGEKARFRKGQKAKGATTNLPKEETKTGPCAIGVWLSKMTHRKLGKRGKGTNRKKKITRDMGQTKVTVEKGG